MHFVPLSLSYQVGLIDPHCAAEVVGYLTWLEAIPDRSLWRLFATAYVHDNALLTHGALSSQQQPVLHHILEQHDSTLSLANITSRALQQLAPNLGSASSLALDTLNCLVACLIDACSAWSVLVPAGGSARWRARLAAKLLPKDTHSRGVLLPGLADGLSALAAALQLPQGSHQHTMMLATLSSTLLGAWTQLVRLKENPSEVFTLNLAVQPAAACALQLLSMDTRPANTAAQATAAAAAPSSSSSTQRSQPGSCGGGSLPQHLVQGSEQHSKFSDLALQAADVLAMGIVAAEGQQQMAAMMQGLDPNATAPSPATPFLGSTELLKLLLVYLGATVKVLHVQRRGQSPAAAWAASTFGRSSSGSRISLEQVPAWHDVLLCDVLGVSLPGQLDASSFTAVSGGDAIRATWSAVAATAATLAHQQKLNQQQQQQSAPTPSTARSAAAAAADELPAAAPWPAALSAVETAGFIRVLLEAMCLAPEKGFIIVASEPAKMAWQMWAAHERHQQQQEDRTPEAAAAAGAQFTELCRGVLLLLAPAVLWVFKQPAAASTGPFARAEASVATDLAGQFFPELKLEKKLAFMLPLMLVTPDGADHVLPALQEQPLLVTTALQAMLRGTAANFSGDAGAHLQLMAYQISTLPSLAHEQLSAALGAALRPAAAGGGASTAGSSRQRRLARELLGLLMTCLKVAAAVRIGESTGSSSWDAIRTAVNAATASMGVVNSGFSSSGGISSGPVNGPAVVLVARSLHVLGELALKLREQHDRDTQTLAASLMQMLLNGMALAPDGLLSAGLCGHPSEAPPAIASIELAVAWLGGQLPLLGLPADSVQQLQRQQAALLSGLAAAKHEPNTGHPFMRTSDDPESGASPTESAVHSVVKRLTGSTDLASQLQGFGRSLNSALPLPREAAVCHNIACRSLTHLSEGQCAAQQCTRCHVARYCSKACSDAMWPQHKPVCQRIRTTGAGHTTGPEGQAAASSADPLPGSAAEAAGLSVRQLKGLLRQAGVDSSSAVEKQDLVQLLVDQLQLGGRGQEEVL